MQARRSLLIWKVFGERLDGFQNDDFPTEIVAGDPKTLHWHGERLEPTTKNLQMSDLDYIGGSMPPPAAIAGTYLGPDKQPIKVPPLSDEEKLTLARWIDLGCPIDLDHNPAEPDRQGYGWMCDDGRPTLTVTYPRSGKNASLDRIVVGMHDYYSGLDPDSFRVIADFELSGVAPGENLAGNFRPLSEGVWQWKLDSPVKQLATGVLKFSIKDRQGNSTQVGRAFSVGK